MRKISLLLVVAVAILTSGCFNIFEELTLNRDGSGTYSLKMDMGALLADEFMKSMLMQSAEENEATQDLAENLEKDTTIYLKDMPAESKAQTGRPEFWDNVTMRIKVSDESDEFYTDIKMKFKDIKDIDFFYQNLGTVMAESGSAASGMMPGDFVPGGAAFKFSKNILTRLPAAKPEEAPEGEDMEMMKMFLSSAKYISTYNLPGNIKKVTIPGAKVSGKTVTVETDLISMMEGKGKIDGDIRFK